MTATAAGVIAAAELRRAARQENFPVDLPLLPGPVRDALRVIYAVARTIDTLGDELPPEDRTAALEAFTAALRELPHATAASHPVLVALRPYVASGRLSIRPFLDLVEANRWDQHRHCYGTVAELRAYCDLSAAPVGRLVLELAGHDEPQLVRWSDDVCAALQVLEHIIDVGEDRRRGRVYVPVSLLERHGVTPDDLAADRTRAALRSALAELTDVATGWLHSGTPLVHALRGWARVAVAGYVAGGWATARALRRHRWGVLEQRVRPRRTDTALIALGLWVGRSPRWT